MQLLPEKDAGKSGQKSDRLTMGLHVPITGN
jgi:hypothetical protein